MRWRAVQGPRSRPGAIERVGTDDLMQLTVDVGPVREQLGVVLLLAPCADADLGSITSRVGERLGSIPRFGQRLTRVPPGCGRPIWVDDPRFRAERHVRIRRCRPPGDRRALLDEAVAVVTTPLSMSEPLWRVAIVTGLADSGLAIVLVCHHVLLDGIGGLAVLERLLAAAAPATAPTSRPAARPAPRNRDLLVDAAAGRLRALRRLPLTLRRARGQVAALRHSRPTRLPSTSLNRATGPHRRAVAVRTDLAAIHASAHAHGATVNDVVLAAVAGALRELLARRGESAPTLVASVPVSHRRSTTVADLGNSVGGMLVPLDTGVDRVARLRRTAATHDERSESAAHLIGPLLRIARALGLLRLYLDHQHVISTVVTNLRGPEQPLTLLTHPVLEILPISHVTGNVTVTFASLSYAGTLVTTATVDPCAVPDADDLAALLQAEFDAYASADATTPSRPPTEAITAPA